MNLHPQVFEWHSERSMGSLIEGDPMFRSYEIWRHAHSRLTPKATDLDRIDVISSLRRAVNHRLKSIRATYNFDCLPSLHGSKQILERLQEYGIVRSAIIKDLFEIRNLIEHEDSDPPEPKQCRHYVDVIWYFLKSTDNLLDVRNDEVRFLHEDRNQFVEVLIDHLNNWAIKINANVNPEYLVNSDTPNTIEIEDYTAKRVKGRGGILWVTGKATLSKDHLVHLARGCFAAIGYYYEDA